MAEVSGTDLLNMIMADDPELEIEHQIQTRLAFTIKRDVLLNLLEKAFTVIPTRDVMPVLKCFQFWLDRWGLRVTASDSELSLIASTQEVFPKHHGTAVFPARKLIEIVKSADFPNVVIAVSGTSPVADIRIGRASWRLHLQGGDDYPAMPVIAEAQFAAVDRLVFRDAILAVRYAASRDPIRPALNILDITDGRLTASDGNRIQQMQIPDFPVTMRIPITAVDDLMRLMKMTETELIHVGQSADKLIFRLGTDLFIVSKFHAAFPDMEAAMLRPALENKHWLHVHRQPLLAAIKRVRITADPDSPAIALNLADRQLLVSTMDKFGNTAADTLAVDWDGADRTLVVNHKHLSDMLLAHGEDSCSFWLGDDTKTRRSPLMLRNSPTGKVGVVQQMLADWAGR